MGEQDRVAGADVPGHLSWPSSFLLRWACSGLALRAPRFPGLTRLFCLLVLEVLFDPCRTWCPASSCQAVCQLQDMGLQTPQLVQCTACDMEFCSACRARWHPGHGCPETMPITFLPGETRYLPARTALQTRWVVGGCRPGEGECLGDLAALPSAAAHTLLLEAVVTCLRVDFENHSPGTRQGFDNIGTHRNPTLGYLPVVA